MLCISSVSAGAWIHGSHEHEAGREGACYLRTGYCHLTILKRLPEHLENIFAKFGKFVQEKHAVVRKRHLAGPRDHPAAYEARVGNGVVRRPERPGSHHRSVAAKKAHCRIDFRYLEGLLKDRLRKDSG